VPIPDDERMNDERLNGERLNGERSDHEGIDDLRIADQPVNDPPIDKQFEPHLQQFRPVAPQPLPVDNHVHAPRRSLVLAAWAAIAATVVAVAVLTFHTQPSRIAPPVENTAIADQLAKPQSLTIRSANAVLATAPSFKDALDRIAFPPKPAPLPADKHSALAELSKEKIKL
jgi:hypothetical protein